MNFPTDGKVELVFSEAIRPRSAENSLVMRPTRDERPTVKVRRNKVVISFPDNLADNTTYILSFGRSIQDYRNNAVENNIQLAFSTGDYLASSSISGTVFNLDPGLLCKIMAWSDNNFIPASISNIQPDYITSTDSRGNFNLSNLSKGKYYLLAVPSKQNIRQISSRDNVAIPNQFPVVLHTDSSNVDQIRFKINNYDLLNPFSLQSAQMEGSYVNCSFSHPVMQTNWDSVSASLSINTPVLKKWRDDNDKKSVKLLFDNLPVDSTLSISLQGLMNARKQKISQQFAEVQFRSKGNIDSIGPALQSSFPPNNEKDVDKNVNPRLNFNEPVYNIDPQTDITLMNSEDSTKFTCSCRFIDDNTLEIVPGSQLDNNTGYSIVCNSASWIDYFGNSYQDSTFSLKFTTLDPRQFGYLSGRLDLGVDISYDNIRLKASRIESEYESITRADSSGRFRFDRLFPGQYQISIWLDHDRDNDYDVGNLFPPEAAEDYIVYPEKYEIRARWETEQIILK